MADDYAISNLENRPFHRAYLDKKLPCPHVSCAAQLGGSFYEETGLAQYYRTNHAADRIGRLRDENIERQAWRLLRLKHGEETQQINLWRKKQLKRPRTTFRLVEQLFDTGFPSRLPLSPSPYPSPLALPFSVPVSPSAVSLPRAVWRRLGTSQLLSLP